MARGTTMRSPVARRVGWLAAFVVLVAGFGPVTEGREAAEAVQELPSPDSLPERCDTAELAVSERYDPVAGPDGTMTPLLLVHGLDSSADMWSGMISFSTQQGGTGIEQNLVEQFVRNDGIAAYTFDYHYQSQRWINDHAIAGRLGNAVDCLEATFDRPVIVVGHSMGGLALRYVANSNDAAGRPRAAKIGLAITFGTPYDGSLVLLLARGATDVGAEYAPKVGLLRLLLATCGQAASHDRGLCPVPLINSLYSEAGDGLAYGSAQLAALDPWPGRIESHALAGSIEVSGTTGLFYNRRETRVDLGDIAVTTDSAIADAVHDHNWNCEYANSPIGSSLDATGVLIGVVPDVERSRYSIEMVTSACLHTRLTNTIQMTNEAIAIVADYIRARPVDSPPEPGCVTVWFAYVGPEVDGSDDLRLVLLSPNPAAGSGYARPSVADDVRVELPVGSATGQAGLELLEGWAEPERTLLWICGPPTGLERIVAAGDGAPDPSPPDDSADGGGETEDITQPADDERFWLPSRNIACQYVELSDRDTLRCDIMSGLAPEPDEPCNGGGGWFALYLEDRGPAIPICPGDSVVYGDFADSGPVLDYGRTWRRGELGCRAEETGLECWSQRGHGFRLARSGWETY
jgi:pimeloyl-ACP methyl ester carboxylesterase